MIELLRRRTAPFVLMLALALVAAACGGGDDGDDGGGGSASGSESAAAGGSEGSEPAEGGGGSGGSYSAYRGEPESLISTNSTESNGSQVLEAVYSGLADYDDEGNPLFGDESEDAVAESVETEDNQNFTVTLKDGWTFHDGTPVTAQSFIDAWNFGALQENAQNGAYFFAPIVGYDDLQCADEDCAQPATATEMSGLSAPDDLTLEIELTEPFSVFPLYLGYTVFYPQPESFIEDPEAANEQPIGNGPYMMAGPWEHDVAINLEKFADYAGTPGNADEVEFRIYTDPQTGFNDVLAGNLDVIDQIPPAQISTAEDQLGERFIDQPSSTLQFVGIPTYDERFDSPDLRHALSLAIPREQIAEQIFSGTRIPATSFASPVVEGSRDDACQGFCDFDPERAKELYDQAGGIDGPLNLWFNTGGGHEEWMEAIANSYRENLGITEINFQSLDFAEYLPLLESGPAGGEGVDGPYRLAWLFDAPSIQNYLEPLYGTGGSSNYTGYSNPEFDDLIAQGNQAETPEEGIELYQQAEDILVEDMPGIPVMYSNLTAGYSENVENVNFDIFSQFNVGEVTIAE